LGAQALDHAMLPMRQRASFLEPAPRHRPRE
jgi:hypothetical protein